MEPDELAAKLAERVLSLVAEQRHLIDPDAKQLAFDQELTDVAREHSDDMAKNDYVAHANAAGETTATMIMDRDAKFRGILGENIASHSYNKDQDVDVDAFAQSLVDSWLNSADHKANLAYAPYERTGIGVAVNSHMIYVTQLFASDLGLPEPPDDPPPATLKLRKPGAPTLGTAYARTGKQEKRISSYAEFWPFYLGEHAQPETRMLPLLRHPAFDSVFGSGGGDSERPVRACGDCLRAMARPGLRISLWKRISPPPSSTRCGRLPQTTG